MANQATFLLQFRADFGPANSSLNQFAANAKRAAKDVANIPPPQIPGITGLNALQGQNLTPQQLGAAAGIQRAVATRQAAQTRGILPGQDFRTPAEVRRGLDLSFVPATSQLDAQARGQFERAEQAAFRHATRQAQFLETQARDEGRIAQITAESLPVYQRLLTDVQRLGATTERRSSIEQRLTAGQALIEGALARHKASSFLYREEQRPGSTLGAARGENRFLEGRQSEIDARQRALGRESAVADLGETRAQLARRLIATERIAINQSEDQRKLAQQSATERRKIEVDRNRAEEQLAAQRKRLVSEGEKITAALPENRATKQLEDAEQRRAVSSARLALQTDAHISAQARSNAAERINNERLRAAEIRELRINQEGIQAKAKRVVEEKLYNDQLRRAIQAEAKAQGVGGGGGFIGRLYGRFGGGGFGGGGGGGGTGPGAIPPTAGQLLGQRALTSLSYTLPSLAFFAGGRFLFNTIKEAEELDRVFANIEAQFDATFGSGSEAAFGEFRKNILAIARDTGITGEELANIAFQLQGAFGRGTGISLDVEGSTLEGTRLVESQTRAAAEISRVTGLSAKEINDSLTAASLEFGESFRDIGNVTVRLQDFTGVLAKETIPFLGDIAPVAKQAGFSLEEFAAIAGVAQQRSGRSGSALAEAFGRVIPQIEENRAKILEFAAATQGLNTPQVLQTIASGDIQDVFFTLGESFNKLDEASRNTLINLLGGRREAQSITAVFANFDDVTRIRDSLASSDGALEERFAKIQETLTQTLARLGEQVRQVGVELFEGGLGDALQSLAEILIVVTDVLGTAARTFGTFNDALGGIPAKILAIAVAIKTLQALGIGRLGGGLQNLPGNALAFAQNTRAAYGATAPLQTAAGATNSATAVGGLYTGQRAAQARAVLPNISQAFALAGAGVSVLEFINARDATAQTLEQSASDLRQRLMTATDEQLQSIIDDANNTMGAFQNGLTQVFTGKDVNQEVLDASQGEAARRKGEAGRAVLEAINNNQAALDEIVKDTNAVAIVQEAIKANPDYLKDSVLKKLMEAKQKETGVTDQSTLLADVLNDQGTMNALVESALSGGELDAELVRLISEGNYARNPAVLAAFTAAKERSGAENALQQVTAELESQRADLDALASQYEQGDATVNQYLAALDAQIASFQGAIDGANAAGATVDPEVIKLLNEFRKTKNDVYFNAISANDDLVDTIIGLGGNEEATIAAQIARATARLTDPQLNNEQQTNAAIQLLDLQQQMFQFRIDAADSAEEALSIMEEGFDIPEEAREQVVIAQLTNTNQGWQNFLTTYKAAFAGTTDAMVQALIVNVLLGKETLDQQKAYLDAQIAQMTAYINSLGEAAYMATGDIESLASLQAARAALDNINFAVAPADRGQASASDRKAAAERAKSERERANKEREREAKELAEAEADFAKALVEGDPVRVAILAQQEADRQFSEATNQAERLRAQAARIRADRQLEQAMFAITQARRDLVQAQLEAAGDTVGSAAASVEAAKEDLARLEALRSSGGAGDAEVIQAQAALVRAETRLRDEQFQKQLDDYEFLYDTGQITRQQFIQYLRGLQASLDPASKQFRDLERQIRGLEKEMGQDLQFNLPSNFTLPTLYEARRIGQTPGGTAGYNDNRQVSVTMYITNGMTEQQAADFLATAVGGNGRFGVTTRRY